MTCGNCSVCRTESQPRTRALEFFTPNPVPLSLFVKDRFQSYWDLVGIRSLDQSNVPEKRSDRCEFLPILNEKSRVHRNAASGSVTAFALVSAIQAAISVIIPRHPRSIVRSAPCVTPADGPTTTESTAVTIPTNVIAVIAARLTHIVTIIASRTADLTAVLTSRIPTVLSASDIVAIVAARFANLTSIFAACPANFVSVLPASFAPVLSARRVGRRKDETERKRE